MKNDVLQFNVTCECGYVPTANELFAAGASFAEKFLERNKVKLNEDAPPFGIRIRLECATHDNFTGDIEVGVKTENLSSEQTMSTGSFTVKYPVTTSGATVVNLRTGNGKMKYIVYFRKGELKTTETADSISELLGECLSEQFKSLLIIRNK